MYAGMKIKRAEEGPILHNDTLSETGFPKRLSCESHFIKL